MTFDQLLKHVHSIEFAGIITADTRQLNAGDVFVAIRGTHVDGHDYIDAAINAGASYIVCEHFQHNETENIIVVKDPSVALGLLAQAAYDNPADKLINLAVTGTNGKTSICYITRSIIQAAGHKCGMIGTIVYDSGADDDTPQAAPLTTPDSATIAKLMSQMITAGSGYMVTEASSHALSQNRLAGVNFTAAAFTNLTGDHLDYHHTSEQYLAEKTKLFTGLKSDSTAILNQQSPEAHIIATKVTAKVLWYAVDEPADISAKIISMTAAGTHYQLAYDGQTQAVNTTLIGKHNISNQLAATGLALAAGIDIETVARGIENAAVIPGRLEVVKGGHNFTVLVDYAHTDDALKNVLSTLKPLCKNKLIVIFGCGGDRDRTKRPRMANEAQKFGDMIIVTSDNPRTEPQAQITDDILKGFANADAENIHVEPDRKKAIQLAVESAQKDDIILIAGKGHEDYQLIGDKKFDFDDKLIAQEFLDSKDDNTDR